MKARYFESANDVLFFDPIVRLLARVFGPERFVIKCKTCGKIPTEVYGNKCVDHV